MDTERREPKRTPKQEADLQRHLRRQKGIRSREGSPATSATKSVAKGCGMVMVMVVVGILAVLVGAVFLFSPIVKEYFPIVMCALTMGMTCS